MIYDQNFDNIDFSKESLASNDFEDCTFSFCNFSDVNLSSVKFTNCEFIDCNLSLCNINGTAFRQVQFDHCKMLGLHFENANQLGLQMNFAHCNLTHASFFQVALKKALFKECKLIEVDFTDGDFNKSIFQGCDFSGAVFYNTNLEQVDFRTSIRYSIHPENNKIKKALFSHTDIHGLLEHCGIVIE